MLLNLVRAWWQAVARPATETFRRLASKRSHVKALTGVLFAAVLGLRISWIIHRLLHDPGEEFMGLASIWLPRGTGAPVANWAILVPLGVVHGFHTFEIVLLHFAWLLGGPEIRLRRTEYDLAEAAERIRRTKHLQTEDFAAHSVLRPLSEKAALEVYSRAVRDESQ